MAARRVVLAVGRNSLGMLSTRFGSSTQLALFLDEIPKIQEKLWAPVYVYGTDITGYSLAVDIPDEDEPE